MAARACSQRAASQHNIDARAWRVVRLDLRVRRNDGLAPLGRLVIAKGDDAVCLREPPRVDGLAGDRDLDAHPASRALRLLRRHLLRRIDGQHLGDVGVDRRRRHASADLRPLWPSSLGPFPAHSGAPGGGQTSGTAPDGLKRSTSAAHFEAAPALSAFLTTSSARKRISVSLGNPGSLSNQTTEAALCCLAGSKSGPARTRLG